MPFAVRYSLSFFVLVSSFFGQLLIDQPVFPAQLGHTGHFEYLSGWDAHNNIAYTVGSTWYLDLSKPVP